MADAASPKLECFFDLTSPWSYLGVTGLRRLAERRGLAVVWRPVLVGGVFNVANEGLYGRRAAMMETPHMAAHYLKDLADWAAYHGVEITGAPPGHPLRAVDFMRAAVAADEMGALQAFMDAGFAAYWRDHRDISSRDVVAEIGGEAGLDPAALLARIDAPECKGKLKAAADELIARGGYGVPSIFVGETDMYFGQDRLPLVERALDRLAEASA
ncbi:MAG: 2-hydroxychromene-2-carboxylate isomerase [Pseudomonadota bacterium]